MKYRLCDIAPIQQGTVSVADEYWLLNLDMIESNTGKIINYVYVKPNEIGTSTIKFDKLNVLYSKLRPYLNKVVLPEQEGYATSEMLPLRPNTHIITREYLTYFLRSKNFVEYINNKTSGAKMPRANISDLKSIEIYCPNIESQKAITQQLDKLLKIIDLRKQQLQQLDELVKARFVEMFGMVGTDEKGWGLIRLGDVCNINPKKVDEPRLKPGLQVSFVPMPAVSEKGEINPSETKNYDEVKSGFTYFREDDVLFAKITPCMENGKGAVAKGLCNGIGFGSTEFHVLRPIENISNSYWIYSVTSFKQFRVDAANNMTGSAGQRRVPASFLESYRISVPPIELQNQFAAFVEQVDKSKVAVQKALDEAQTLFNSVMQQYFG